MVLWCYSSLFLLVFLCKTESIELLYVQASQRLRPVMIYDKQSSGGSFDVVQFLLHPATLLRCFQMLFAIITFGVLAHNGSLYGMER